MDHYYSSLLLTYLLKLPQKNKPTPRLKPPVLLMPSQNSQQPQPVSKKIKKKSILQVDLDDIGNDFIELK